MPRTKGSRNRPKFTPLSFGSESDVIEEQLEFEQSVFPGISDIANLNPIEQNEVINTAMEITHSLKVINQGNFPEIEQDIKTRFFDKGWRLFATHFGGMLPEGMVIIYIFTREVSAG